MSGNVVLWVSFLGLGCLALFAGCDEATAVRQSLEDRASDFWIYDDLDAGYRAARASGKPLLVSIRCVP